MIRLGVDCIFVLFIWYYVDNNRIATANDTKIISVSIDRTSSHVLTDRFDSIILSTRVKTFDQGRQKQFSVVYKVSLVSSLKKTIIQSFQN